MCIIFSFWVFFLPFLFIWFLSTSYMVILLLNLSRYVHMFISSYIFNKWVNLWSIWVVYYFIVEYEKNKTMVGKGYMIRQEKKYKLNKQENNKEGEWIYISKCQIFLHYFLKSQKRILLVVLSFKTKNKREMDKKRI